MKHLRHFTSYDNLMTSPKYYQLQKYEYTPTFWKNWNFKSRLQSLTAAFL